MPYLGKSPSFGVRQRYQNTATASQTTFSGTDTANLTLNYTDNNFVDVYQNGVLLKGGGNDYTATSGTSVVLGTGATADDVIEIIVYDVFSVGNFYSRTDSDSRYLNVAGDTMTGSLDLNGTELVLDVDGDSSITSDTDDQIDFRAGGTDIVSVTSSGVDVTGAITASSASSINVTGGSALTLKSTDTGSTAGPVLALQRDSASPADNDLIGKVIFSADDDGGNSVDFATVNVKAVDVSDGSEDGEYDVSTIVGGTSRSRIRMDGTETIINENGQNLDFRVEGVAEANVLVVDAANDNVLIGCNALRSDSVGGAGFENAADDRMILNLSTTTTSSRNVVVFRNPNNAVGTINTSGTTTGFNTSSDYRLKENVVTDWDATSRLKKLKPSQFNFKADKDTTVDGFLAHEVSSVVPIAITGEKDAVDKDGNPEYQGIDQSKLVPLLTKALQESIARADALEARIKKLEDG